MPLLMWAPVELRPRRANQRARAEAKAKAKPRSEEKASRDRGRGHPLERLRVHLAQAETSSKSPSRREFCKKHLNGEYPFGRGCKHRHNPPRHFFQNGVSVIWVISVTSQMSRLPLPPRTNRSEAAVHRSLAESVASVQHRKEGTTVLDDVQSGWA